MEGRIVKEERADLAEGPTWLCNLRNYQELRDNIQPLKGFYDVCDALSGLPKDT